jgi:chemotaxis methyl-accepting protein methylase
MFCREREREKEPEQKKEYIEKEGRHSYTHTHIIRLMVFSHGHDLVSSTRFFLHEYR